MTTTDTIGERIKSARLKAELSMESVALACGRQKAWLQKIENSTNQVYVRDLIRIARAIGVRPRQLLPADK